IPHCPPSPSAFLISSPVSGLYTIPTSLIPASNTASIAKWIIGLLAIGIRCLLLVCVIGLSLVPLPPLVMSAFIVYLSAQSHVHILWLSHCIISKSSQFINCSYSTLTSFPSSIPYS